MNTAFHRIESIDPSKGVFVTIKMQLEVQNIPDAFLQFYAVINGLELPWYELFLVGLFAFYQLMRQGRIPWIVMILTFALVIQWEMRGVLLYIAYIVALEMNDFDRRHQEQVALSNAMNNNISLCAQRIANVSIVMTRIAEKKPSAVGEYEKKTSVEFHKIFQGLSSNVQFMRDVFQYQFGAQMRSAVESDEWDENQQSVN